MGAKAASARWANRVVGIVLPPNYFVVPFNIECSC